MKQLMWVCLGSALGGGARYLLSGWVQNRVGLGFPLGTVFVNLVGSFLIGVVMYAGVRAAAFSTLVRVTLAVGVLGGFTTFSSFTYETMDRMQAGAWGAAVGNVVLSVLGCLFMCCLGWAGTRYVIGG
ncbi:MAG: fluoride efflux transporter CrcB [Polyangiaceae bacterium]|nr:fluoride efflux transporter CrcB [Polyangiaceae bacterium]